MAVGRGTSRRNARISGGILRNLQRTRPTCVARRPSWFRPPSPLRAGGAVDEHQISYRRGPASAFSSRRRSARLATARSTSAVLKVENCPPPNCRAPRPCCCCRAPHRCRPGCRPPAALNSFSSVGSGCGSVLARRTLSAIASASVRLMRDGSGVDFDIFLVPSRNDITRVAGPGSAARWKNASPKPRSRIVQRSRC